MHLGSFLHRSREGRDSLARCWLGARSGWYAVGFSRLDCAGQEVLCAHHLAEDPRRDSGDRRFLTLASVSAPTVPS
jgi:hypothetical protein